jgi:hypothetical protein
MATAAQSIESFRIPYTPDWNRGQRTTVICIDERAAILRGLLLVGRAMEDGSYTTLNRVNARPADLLYLRTAAGAAGIGQDMHVTMRVLQKRGIPVQLNPGMASAYQRYQERTGVSPRIAPARILGSMAAKAAATHGVDICTHVNCAAEINAGPIGNGIATNRGNAGENIRGLATPHWRGQDGLTEVHREIEVAYADGLDDGMLATYEKSAALLDQGDKHEGGLLRAVPRVPLTAMPHVSDTLIMDWDEGVTLDAGAATAATLETGEVWTHYYASMGSMDMIADIIITDVLDVDRRDFNPVFKAAAFVRNTATSLWLPEQHGQVPGIHTLAAAA